jgi:hypothetical protein
LVEIVDLSCCECDGENQISVGLTENTDHIDGILPLKRTELRIPGTLRQLRQHYRKMQRKMEDVATTSRLPGMLPERNGRPVLENLNIYFDPLCYCWKAWYLNLDFQPVFVHEISGRP